MTRQKLMKRYTEISVKLISERVFLSFAWILPVALYIVCLLINAFQCEFYCFIPLCHESHMQKKNIKKRMLKFWLGAAWFLWNLFFLFIYEQIMPKSAWNCQCQWKSDTNKRQMQIASQRNSKAVVLQMLQEMNVFIETLNPKLVVAKKVWLELLNFKIRFLHRFPFKQLLSICSPIHVRSYASSKWMKIILEIGLGLIMLTVMVQSLI